MLGFLLVFEYMKTFAPTKQRRTISTDKMCKTEDVDTFGRKSLAFIHGFFFFCVPRIKNDDVPQFDFISFLGIGLPPQRVGTVNRLFVAVMICVKGQICG